MNVNNSFHLTKFNYMVVYKTPSYVASVLSLVTYTCSELKVYCGVRKNGYDYARS